MSFLRNHPIFIKKIIEFCFPGPQFREVLPVQRGPPEAQDGRQRVVPDRAGCPRLRLCRGPIRRPPMRWHRPWTERDGRSGSLAQKYRSKIT